MNNGASRSVEEIDRANLYHSYTRGWRHGAAGRAKDPVFAAHPNTSLNTAYEKGYADGVAAFSQAAHAAQTIYGHTPTILRST